MTWLDAVRCALAEIEAHGRLRHVDGAVPAGLVDFSSNDYLALARDGRVVEALRRADRVGSGGARLLGGRHRDHALLEEELAAFLGRERVLLFSSGYLAAIGTIPVAARFVAAIYSDALNHASLIDGIRLARARKEIYPHAALPPSDRRIRPALVVSETAFSMDGDTIDVAGVVGRLHADDVLLLDEAHALGVLGPQGAGLAFGIADPRLLVLGTLSKSFGGLGGFVAGPSPAIELLVNAARGFIFDTALPPALALAARVALMLVRGEEGERRRARLRENAARLRAGLRAIGIAAAESPSPIVPVLLGDEQVALRASAALQARGLHVPAIRPPTVPPGTSRLRIGVRCDHTAEQIDLLVEALAQCIATS